MGRPRVCCYHRSVKLDLPRGPEFEAGVWYSTHASSWYPTHHHDELEVKLVLWGTTAYRIGAQEVVLGPGSLLWLAPGQDHTLLTVSGDLAMWVASFRNPTAHAAERLSGARVLDRARGWGACVLPPARVRELSALHPGLVHCDEPALANPRGLELLTRALLSFRGYARAQDFESGAGRGSPLHAAVARARDLLCSAHGDLPLGSLARRCGLDGSRLSRVFKQQMGLSIVQFRNHFRIQQFITRFGRGEQRNMLEVALDSGFGSYPQFHRAFHQVTGYAPSEHLRRIRAGIVVPAQQSLKASRELAP